MSDQEGPIRALFRAALLKLAMEDELVSAVPESSAVGESQSNGLPERCVQTLEDLVRTYKLVIQDRMEETLCTSTPLFKWLLEHAASVYNRYRIGG